MVDVAILHNVQIISEHCHDSAVMLSASWLTDVDITACHPIDSYRMSVISDDVDHAADVQAVVCN